MYRYCILNPQFKNVLTLITKKVYLHRYFCLKLSIIATHNRAVVDNNIQTAKQTISIFYKIVVIL